MIDLEDLKKLPANEKLRIIDELEDSMEGEEYDPEFGSEVMEEMERRYQEMVSGKDEGCTWEEAKAILITDRNTRRSTNV